MLRTLSRDWKNPVSLESLMEPKHAFLERHVFLRSISNKNNLKAAVWRLFLLGHEIFHINYITNKTIKEKDK